MLFKSTVPCCGLCDVVQHFKIIGQLTLVASLKCFQILLLMWKNDSNEKLSHAASFANLFRLAILIKWKKKEFSTLFHILLCLEKFIHQIFCFCQKLIHSKKLISTYFSFFFTRIKAEIPYQKIEIKTNH